MSDSARVVQRTYLLLTLLTTLAASFIWGINTLFLLDAGLNNAEAFAANAFFTLGEVIFEVPTGVVADTRGRRFSYLLGAGDPAAVHAAVPCDVAGPRAAAGLGGRVDPARASGSRSSPVPPRPGWSTRCSATGFTGHLEQVFGRAQTIGGVAMLVGSVSGGFIAQATNLGVPYLARAAMLGRDARRRPALHARPRVHAGQGREPRGPPSAAVIRGSIDGGFRNRPVRWLMLAAPFTAGVGIYVFYAAQPYLLQLYGDTTAYGIAGLAAALVAGAQIVGGLPCRRVRRFFRRRTDALILGGILNVALLAVIGLTGNFVIALGAARGLVHGLRHRVAHAPGLHQRR